MKSYSILFFGKEADQDQLIEKKEDYISLRKLAPEEITFSGTVEQAMSAAISKCSYDFSIFFMIYEKMSLLKYINRKFISLGKKISSN